MKELLQRQAQEKLQRKLHEQNLAQATSIAATASGTSNSIHGVGNSPGVVQPTAVEMLGPASSMGSVAQSPHQHLKLKLNNVAATMTPNSSLPTSASSSSVSSAASVPLPISTTSITAQFREKLAKMTPQERALCVQQLTQSRQQLNIAGSSQLTPGQPATVNQAVLLTSATRATKVPSSTLNSNSLKVTAAVQATNIQQILEQQQKLVKEQQQVSLNAMGSTAVKQTSSRLPISSAPSSRASNHLGVRSVGASVSPSKGGQSRTAFVDIKLSSGVNKSASPPSSGKGKGKVKSETGKNAADE